MLTIEAEDKQLIIQPDLKRIQDCKMKIDTQRLQQVLLNLLSNAIKFSHKGGTIKISAWIEHSPNKTLLKVSIKDNGIGIAT